MDESLRVVVIEDEAPIRRFLSAGLSLPDGGFFESETAIEGIKMVAQKDPHVVLLDLGLPDMDGVEVIQRIREWTRVPIIVLSARGKESDKVAALDAGADDYLTKPFSIPELMARIRVARRHGATTEQSTIFSHAGLVVDFAARTVRMDGVELHLTHIEYRLLATLAQHAGMVITQKQLLADIWGPGYEFSTHTLRVHMGNLRSKLGDGQNGRRLIRTETGVGYRLVSS
ncbi:MAG: response regulator [Armatimonadetes bacterium]|nr:response regulator [Armatimonadota bacterium]